jgi:hypothetical protein
MTRLTQILGSPSEGEISKKSTELLIIQDHNFTVRVWSCKARFIGTGEKSQSRRWWEPSTVASIAAGASPHRREPGMLCDARQRMDTLQQLGGIIQKAKGEMALRIIFRRWTGADSLAREVNKKLEILAAP